MNKLKMLVLTALAAVTVGTGALAATPSASAAPMQSDYCKSLLAHRRAAMDLSILFYHYGDNYWGALLHDGCQPVLRPSQGGLPLTRL
jgi:hypothetical protein